MPLTIQVGGFSGPSLSVQQFPELFVSRRMPGPLGDSSPIGLDRIIHATLLAKAHGQIEPIERTIVVRYVHGRPPATITNPGTGLPRSNLSVSLARLTTCNPASPKTVCTYEYPCS